MAGASESESPTHRTTGRCWQRHHCGAGNSSPHGKALPAFRSVHRSGLLAPAGVFLQLMVCGLGGGTGNFDDGTTQNGTRRPPSPLTGSRLVPLSTQVPSQSSGAYYTIVVVVPTESSCLPVHSAALALQARALAGLGEKADHTE